MPLAHLTGSPGAVRAAPAKGSARPAVPSLKASVLDLQTLAGNQAVTGLLAQRVGPPVLETAYKTTAEIDAMKLRDLDDYANLRPDWSTDPTLAKARRRSLLDTLAFARAGEPKPLGPCGGMLVTDLEKTHLTPQVRARLRNYSRGVAETDTVAVPSTDVVADALRDGEAVGKLEAGISKPTLHHAMGTKDEGKAEFPELVGKGMGEVERFASYFRRSGAFLEADNGADAYSYREMVDKDGKHPDEFIGKLPGVKNFHRFHAEMLTQLAANTHDLSRKRPLLLILHAGTDHNGAFHRDKELTNLVKHPRNLAIMIEGPTSLDAAGSAASDVAKRYGRKKKIQQLMLAGHGNSQLMEMGGKADPKTGRFAGDAIDVANNKARTEKFLKGLVANMESGPDARIVLNACLTAADTVAANLDPDPAKAKAQILDSLKNSPSLAAELGRLAPGRVVEGNVSSVPAGKYMAEDAMGNPTGVLHQIIPSDPLAAGSDRAAYVEDGKEAEGCMRAAVALWALDKSELLKRVAARRAKPIADWDDRVIHVFYDMIAAEPDNAALMNQIANSVAGGLSEFDLDAEQKPGNVWGLHAALDPGHADTIFSALHKYTTPGGKLAMDSVWMIRTAAREAIFMTELDGFATTKEATPRLHPKVLAFTSAKLLPAGSAKAPTSAQMKLALWLVTGGRKDAAAVAFLAANAGKAGALTMPAGTTVDGLTGGAATEHDVLETCGLLPEAPVVPGGADEPKPNMDLDDDGVNETFVRSITRTSKIAVSLLNVRSRPDIASSRIDAVPGGHVIDVIGVSGDWYMVDLRGKVGFVFKSMTKDVAVA